MIWLLHPHWLRRMISLASMTALAVCVSDPNNGSPTGYGVYVGARAVHYNPSLLPTPAVQAASKTGSSPELTFEGFMPELSGGVGWINSAALSAKALRRKFVPVTFWTYTCINSLRALPYLRAWSAKYKDSGLVVIGVHTPEFSFERDRYNVAIATRESRITYPVVMDNNYEIWRSFSNEAWPAFYLIDAKGHIRHHQFGEGHYEAMECALQALLREKGSQLGQLRVEDIVGQGIEAPPSADQRSPESYVGYRLSARFASPGGLKESREKIYNIPKTLALNQWGLIDLWEVNSESAVLVSASGKITFRFHSRDLNLVMASSRDDMPIRFRVTLDGAPPGNDCGLDSAPDGTGVVREPRLYQMVRQKTRLKIAPSRSSSLSTGCRHWILHSTEFRLNCTAIIAPAAAIATLGSEFQGEALRPFEPMSYRASRRREQTPS